MARLRSVGSTAGETRQLDGEVIRVGRIEDNDIVIDDPVVSRTHARLERDSGLWRIVDLGSTNGTRVNDIPLRPWHPRALKSTDQIDIGPRRFEFMLDPADAEQAGRPTTNDTPTRDVMLTPSEANVLELLFMHYDAERPVPRLATLAEIAQRRFTSTDAVKALLRSLYRKFELSEASTRNKEQLAVRAQEYGVTRHRY